MADRLAARRRRRDRGAVDVRGAVYENIALFLPVPGFPEKAQNGLRLEPDVAEHAKDSPQKEILL